MIRGSDHIVRQTDFRIYDVPPAQNMCLPKLSKIIARDMTEAELNASLPLHSQVQASFVVKCMDKVLMIVVFDKTTGFSQKYLQYPDGVWRLEKKGHLEAITHGYRIESGSLSW